MTLEALTWCWDNSAAGGLDLLALLTLADNYHSNWSPTSWQSGGGVWPGYDHIAQRCHVSEDDARSAVARLIALREVAIDHQRCRFELPLYDDEDQRQHREWVRINDGFPVAIRDREPPPPKPNEVVYVIGSPGSSLVKIGKSQNIRARLRSIQNMSPAPLSVLWTTPGGRALETRLHDAFDEYRVHGEWFDFGDADPLELVTAELAGAR